MKPQHMGWWHFIRAERLFPYPTSLLHLHLHSPPPCTVRLFYKNPADSFPMLSEGHATTLGSPPPGTSCALFKHTALQKEQRERERSPGPTAGAEDARVNDSLQRPQQPPEGSSRPPAKLFNWHADGQSSAPLLQRQPKRSLLFCLPPLRRSRRQTTIMRCQLYLQRQINAIPLLWFNSRCQGNK